MASILSFNGKTPSIADGVFLAPDAQIIGDVTIEEGSSIWFGAVIRGDFGPIHIGKYTSIQDNCVVHVTEKGTRVGDYNTIGHGAVLHECQLGANVVIGMNAVLLDETVVESDTVIGANSTISVGTRIPGRTLAAGSPAKVKKELEGESLWWVQNSANEYIELLKKYPDDYFHKNTTAGSR
ncbi:gamma carbonic anhydrase family protein [Alteribacillus iranensis]|uniref:Carbonic anhydrase or acetyltransferase, isoleucine patch superfamily n=1 Tax=Alteribacillus iranensis TaxID=930128 RepID=A0A1I2BP05_9BACI|nr:gamma carbonic anhydrase family protein [Alteribacillus iranensis]SFE57789.1 Carbonic anhydrase or acetyltransferase, isoleucine patch superfamily [Alteribacillus iranensis]